MILCLCLNPAIDKSIDLLKFIPGQTNRSQGERQVPSGKGINCARVLTALGQQASVACFMSLQDQQETAPLLEKSGIRFYAVPTEERLRVNLKIFDKSRGEVTEINAPGARVLQKQLNEMTALVKSLAPACDWLLLTGSLPPGCPPDYYQSLARLIRKKAPSSKIALDAGGEAFRLALSEKPDLIKPNLEELSDFLGRPVTTRQEAQEGAAQLAQEGAGDVLLSMGREGALLYGRESKAFSPGLSLPVVTTVGAGDAMLSGFVAGKARGLDDRQSFRLALSAAACAVTGQTPHPALINEWLPLFFLQEIG